MNFQYSIQNNQCSIKKGFRQMDVQLGRWHVVDAMAEKYMSTSSYAYTMNDPINHTNLKGLQAIPMQYWTLRGELQGPVPNGRMEYSEAGGGGWVSVSPFAVMDFGFGSSFGGSNIFNSGPTGAAYDAFIAMGGGSEGSSFGDWYGAGGRAGMSLMDYLAPDIIFSYNARNNSIILGSGIKNLFKNSNDRSLLASVDGAGTEPKPNWFAVALAHFLRNSNTIGTIVNPFYKAEAITGDIGFLTFAGEGDVGGVFILAGQDIGKFISYNEITDLSVVFEMSAGAEVGRIDFTGNPSDFRSNFIYGKRHKAMIGGGLSPATYGFGLGISCAWGKPTGTSHYVITTGLSISWGVAPYPIVPGYNHGTIYP